MHRLRRSFLLEGLKAFDASVVAASLVLGLFLSDSETHRPDLAGFLSLRVSLRNVLLALAFLAAASGVFEWCGLYRSQRLGARGPLYHAVARAVSAATLLLAALLAVFRIGAFNYQFVMIFWASTAGLVAASRAVLYRALEALRRNGRNLRHVLIAGAGPRGRRFAESIESRAELGYRVLGFLDDPYPGFPSPPNLLGPVRGLPRLLAAGQVDEVVIALPLKTFYPEVAWIISVCERQGVIARLPGDLFDARLARLESEQFEDLSVLTLFTASGSTPGFLVKRLSDMVLSAAALAAAAPLWPLIALAIRLDSPGPALFRQLRVGHNGRRFLMWKFRTMTANAEQRQAELEDRNEVRGAAFKIHNDPRVTRVGRWLRRASLDELPQLINVLKGEMSLVGPRPLPLRDVERLDQDWQRRRFSVRPGLTCLWQASGRHELAFDDWMRLDLDYIDNWSLLLDLKILLRTVPTVWTGAGAS